MDDINTIIAVLLVAYGIFMLILLVKIWKMTNHVETIKYYLEKLMYMKEREYEDKYGDED
mgnify:CR=1 FL=1